MVVEVVARQVAFALGGAPLAERQQPREPAIGRPVGREAQHARTIVEIEPRADDEADARRLGRHMGAHHAGQRVAVGDGERLEAERGGGDRQLVGVRRAAQEAEVRGDLELGVAGHGDCSWPSRV